MALLGELLIAIGVDDRDLAAATARADRQFGRMTQSAKALTSAGKSLTMGLTMPLLAVGATAIQTAAKFDKSMAAVEAVTDATASELVQLENAARSWAKGTSFTATEAADALGELGKAGFTATQAVDGLGPVLQLATAGGLEMAKAAGIASVIMNTMGLSAKDLGQVTDALAKGAAVSVTNVEQMGYAFARSSAASKAAGLNVNEAAEAVALMAEAGFRGTAAGTGLNMVLGQLNMEGSKGAKLFKEYDVELRRSDGSLRRLSDIALDAKKAGITFNDVVEAFGKNHGPKFAAILGLNNEKLKAVQKSMENTEGAGAKMATTMEDNLEGAFKRLQSAWEELQLTLLRDTGVSEALKVMTDKLAAVIVKIADFARAHPSVTSLTGAFVGLAAIIGPAMVAIGFMIGQLRNLAIVATLARTAVTRLNFAFLASPVFLVIAAFAALGIAIAVARQKSDGFRQATNTAFAMIKSAFQDIITIVSRVKAAFGEGGLGAAARTAADAFSELGPQILTKLQGAFSVVFQFIVASLPQIIAFLMQMRTVILNAAIQMFSALVQALPTIVPQLVTALMDSINMLISVLITLTPMIAAGALTLFTGLVNGIVQVLPVLIEALVNLIDVILVALLAMLPTIIAVGIQILLALINGIVQTIPLLLDLVMTLLPTLANLIITLLPVLVDAGIKILQALLDGIIALLPKLLGFVITIIPMLVVVIIKMLPKLIAAGIQLIWALIKGLTIALVKLIAFAITLVIKLGATLISQAGKLIVAGVKLLGSFLMGLIQAVPKAISWIRALPGRLGSVVRGGASSLVGAGAALISGLISGIRRMAGAAVSAAKSVVSGAIAGAKRLLGIGSPSRVFIEIGAFTTEGLSIGLLEEMRKIDRAADMLMRPIEERAQETQASMRSALQGTSAAVAAHVRSDVNARMVPAESRVRIDVTGADEGMKELIRRLMRTSNLVVR